jgi:hypothetical protein
MAREAKKALSGTRAPKITKSTGKPRQAIEKISKVPDLSKAKVGTQVLLSDKEAIELRNAEGRIWLNKQQLADIQIQFMELERQRAEKATAVLDSQGDFMFAVKEIAKAHGIDVDNPDNGKWDFSTTDMTFTKTD